MEDSYIPVTKAVTAGQKGMMPHKSSLKKTSIVVGPTVMCENGHDDSCDSDADEDELLSDIELLPQYGGTSRAAEGRDSIAIAKH